MFGVAFYYSITQPILTDTQYKGSQTNILPNSNTKPSIVAVACTRFLWVYRKLSTHLGFLEDLGAWPHRAGSLE